MLQLLVAAAACLEQPAAVPPQLLAITASGAELSRRIAYMPRTTPLL